MPGNQPGNSGDVELKIGYMVKRSQGKSTIGAVNFKKRVFVLTRNRLLYFDGNLDVSLIYAIMLSHHLYCVVNRNTKLVNHTQ